VEKLAQWWWKDTFAIPIDGAMKPGECSETGASGPGNACERQEVDEKKVKRPEKNGKDAVLLVFF
jgi:hypothetical protein